jgi:prefoldin subunit 5
VPGTLADPENVIVDVGTGFYVEKVGDLELFAELDADLNTEHERCYEILRG